MNRRCQLCTAALALGIATAASAEEWRWAPAAYGWLAGLDGKSGVGPSISTINDSFSDIIDDLDFAAMASVEVSNGEWGVITDLVFIDLGSDENTPIGNVSTDVKQWIVTAAPYYRVVSTDEGYVDIGAGARFMDLELEISVPNDKGALSRDWFDPLVMARTRVGLAEKIALTLHGDIGGFGVESDFAWLLSATVDYVVSETVSLAGGYRYYDVDYEKDDLLYDTATHGLVLGVRWAL